MSCAHPHASHAAAIMATMLAFTPLAGAAAAVAWVTHAALLQFLSLRTYESSVRRLWAPPLHRSVLAVRSACVLTAACGKGTQPGVLRFDFCGRIGFA